MKKWFSKLLCVIMLLVMAFSFASCKEKKANQYNAKLIDQAHMYMSDMFLAEHITRGALMEGVDTDKEIYQKNYRFIVDTREEFNGIFQQEFISVDFEKEMLFVYLFTSYYMGETYQISEIKEVGSTLQVVLKRKKKNNEATGNASMPQQRCFVVKTDKVNVVDVEFDVI